MSENNGFLVDTSILSAFAPGRPDVDGKVARWMKMQGEAGRLHLSVITASEIQRGIRKLTRAGGVDRGKALAKWLRDLTEHYGDRLLPIDVTVARIAGDIEDEAIAGGKHPGFADVLIASTAMVHGLTVLTANTKHFMPLGATCLNPLLQIPPMALEDLNLPKPPRP